MNWRKKYGTLEIIGYPKFVKDYIKNIGFSDKANEKAEEK